MGTMIDQAVRLRNTTTTNSAIANTMTSEPAMGAAL
jgi:hypothetical protein